jgi:hypothetical protein
MGTRMILLVPMVACRESQFREHIKLEHNTVVDRPHLLPHMHLAVKCASLLPNFVFGA